MSKGIKFEIIVNAFIKNFCQKLNVNAKKKDFLSKFSTFCIIERCVVTFIILLHSKGIIWKKRKLNFPKIRIQLTQKKLFFFCLEIECIWAAFFQFGFVSFHLFFVLVVVVELFLNIKICLLLKRNVVHITRQDKLLTLCSIMYT